MDDMGTMMKLMNAWRTFTANHPKFPAFMSAVSRRGITEGSIIEMSVTFPDGEKMETNLKVSASDLELVEQIRALSRDKQ